VRKPGLRGTHLSLLSKLRKLTMLQNCKYLDSVPQTTLYFHQDSCRPYCKPCYTDHTLQPRSTFTKFRHHHCRCAPVTLKPNFAQRYWRGSQYYTSRKDRIKLEPRAMCRDCYLLENETMLKRRENRTKMELRNGLKSNGEQWIRCGRQGCSNDLGAGPRWWMCGREGCMEECISTVHGAWGSKVDSPVSDQAV
jgi:hypothetical protein